MSGLPLTRLFDPTPWMKDAACVGASTDLFFPSRGEDQTEAKAVCAECPVRMECLEYALNNRILFGVWGGLSERERRRVRAQRRSGAAEASPQHPRRRNAPSGMDVIDAVASWHDVQVLEILSRARPPHLVRARCHVVLILRDLGATWASVAGFLDMGVATVKRAASQATDEDYDTARRIEQAMENDRPRMVAS